MKRKTPAPNSKAGRMAAAARNPALTSQKMSSRKGCLETAMAAVTGDRALNYGSAEDNFERIAILQNAYLAVRKADRGAPLTPHDVTMFSIMVKIARLANTPDHADSWADIAGYAACGAEIADAKY